MPPIVIYPQLLLRLSGWYNRPMVDTNLTPPSEPAQENAEPAGLPAQDAPAAPPARPSVLLWSVLVVVAFVFGLFTGYMIWERRAVAAEQKVAELENAAAADATAAADAANTAAEAAIPDQVKRYDVPVDDDYVLGGDTAPITIIEFSDYECPFCQRWHQEVYGQLQETYGDKIRLVYRDFPLYGLHANAESAAEAANCAGEQERYYEYHNLLLSGGKEFGADTYKAYAESLKLDVKGFTQCMDEHRYLDEVKADYDYASQLGVRSTPTFFINGLAVVGAQPFEQFKEIIDLELAGKIPK